MKNVTIASNNMVYVGKSLIECYYYKWYSVRFLSYVFYEGMASLKKAYSVKRCLYLLLMRCVVSALRRLVKKSSVLIRCLRSFRSFPEGC